MCASVKPMFDAGNSLTRVLEPSGCPGPHFNGDCSVERRAAKTSKFANPVGVLGIGNLGHHKAEFDRARPIVNAQVS